MSTVRFSLVAFASKSWVAEAWSKVVAELFGSRVVTEMSRVEGVCETKWEAELKRLQREVHTLCHHAVHQLIPMAGTYQQYVLNRVIDAYTVYAPEEAERIFTEGNKRIENIKGHILGIRYNAHKMREANRRVEALEDMHAKAVMYHHSVLPYMDTLKFHIEQLKAILR